MNIRTSLLLFAAAGSTAAAGDVTLFFANIDSGQSIPGSGSPAFGSMTGSYDSSLNEFSFSWEVSSLLGTPAAPGAHIHMGNAGETGPIVFGFNEPDGTWDLSGSAVWTGLSSDEVDALFNEGLYLNFHTDQFPAGETRGQIRVVPTPGVLAAIGMGGLVASRRRR